MVEIWRCVIGLKHAHQCFCLEAAPKNCNPKRRRKKSVLMNWTDGKYLTFFLMKNTLLLSDSFWGVKVCPWCEGHLQTTPHMSYCGNPRVTVDAMSFVIWEYVKLAEVMDLLLHPRDRNLRFAYYFRLWAFSANREILEIESSDCQSSKWCWWSFRPND